MSDDQDLSQRLTALLRTIDGVDDVFPAQPVVEAAADAIAVKLALREPDVLVDIDRSGGSGPGSSVTVRAGIAANDGRPAGDTLREVGERVRDELTAAGEHPDLVTVSVRVIEGLGAPAPAPPADLPSAVPSALPSAEPSTGTSPEPSAEPSARSEGSLA